MREHARLLETLSQWVMVLGIIALCQPWIEVAHRYSVTIILAGLVGFLIFAKVPSPEPGEDR
jgi:hypothetical protein